MIKIEEISKEELEKLKEKYIFHGSPVLFETCKPHKAFCMTHKKENEMFAIYGSDNFEFALLFSFAKLPHIGSSWSANHKDGKVSCCLKNGTTIDENASGYLYCFEKKYFHKTEEGFTQYVCDQEIEPQRILKVYYKDYKNLFTYQTINNERQK